MHLIYIDDSYEKPCITFSAVAIPANRWLDIFTSLKSWRHSLKESDGILVTREFHATEFVSGHGRLGPRVVTKHRRSQIFFEALRFFNQQKGLRVFNVCRTHHTDWAFERLLNRIDRTMREWDSHALLICDEGKEAEYTRLVRKMSVHNPIPSRYGVWLDTGEATRNITIDRILEDPFFKESDRSYLIQMADFCAYALLRREKRLPSKDMYRIHTCFDALIDVVVRQANPADPMGIIR